MNYGRAILPFYIELFLAFGQIPFQWIVLRKENRETQFEYFGNLITVSVFGSLLLTLGIIANTIMNVPPEPHTLCFLITATIMFFEHLRRVELLQLPVKLCISWLSYRFLLLLAVVLYISITK
ncbi:hypothetical protein ACLI08_12300 [Flavobacterium sp. RNTU_13]|uniref:hypothetical protein n=1 Tax=Flavobacterium sp. RNTU_13 TaxID=3375145 RepID=UPI0039884491